MGLATRPSTHASSSPASVRGYRSISAHLLRHTAATLRFLLNLTHATLGPTLLHPEKGTTNYATDWWIPFKMPTNDRQNRTPQFSVPSWVVTHRFRRRTGHCR